MYKPVVICYYHIVLDFHLKVKHTLFTDCKAGYITGMATIRMTVCIEEALFKRGEELAQELQISRSRLYTLALESFFEENEKLKLANAPGSVNIGSLAADKLDLFSDYPTGPRS